MNAFENAFDPDVIQDFLTESGELLDQLDTDLVLLESAPEDPDLINQAFRALHTIKGSASFLALTELVAIAHAAEDVLNSARRGEAAINRTFMDLILEAVDVVRRHLGQIVDGEPLETPPAELIEKLGAIGSGAAAAPADAAAGEDEGEGASDAPAADAPADALKLPESKLDLLEFMVEDLKTTLLGVPSQLERFADESQREDAAGELEEACEALQRSTEFFECRQMSELVGLIGLVASHADRIEAKDFEQITPRLRGVLEVLKVQADALEVRRVRTFAVDDLVGRLTDLVLGNGIDADEHIAPDAEGLAALAADGVTLDDPAGASSGPAAEGAETPDAAPEAASDAGASAPDEDAPQQDGSPKAKAVIEQTIRVEVGRLESLQNLVGELVLQKNRIGALVRQVSGSEHVGQELREAVDQSTGDLDRVTSDIQVAVMRTRMQPLDKLFGKYPRLIRDLARKTNKQIELRVIGGETEVDKSVIEHLGDPLVHLLRNAADHGVEPPDARLSAGKPESGTITLRAAHEGSHVRVDIEDDGAGLVREKLAAKGVERGMATAEEAAQLTDKQVFRFIFAPGFSTADQVSDLSGRGVGMDVVRTNIEKLKGSIDIDSEAGKGSIVSIKIPLTVAIMPAMLVGVCEELYAIPLHNILEIVRPEEDQISTVRGRRVLRLRDLVLPLVDVSDLFDVPPTPEGEARFVVVAIHNEQRVGLLVSRLIGQQEIVIKPLDDVFKRSGPVSGATVRDDGGVSLIVDIGKMIEAASKGSRKRKEVIASIVSDDVNASDVPQRVAA